MKTLMQPILTPIQEFGACLKQILESRRTSASELARMMAYKSRNSIFRILDEEGGHGVRMAFCERLISEDPLGLSEAERQALWQALEVSRVGRHAFMSNYAMRRLLMDVEKQDGITGVRIDIRGQSDTDFRHAFTAMARGKKVYLTITGCCDRVIFEALRACLYNMDAGCEIAVKHFIYMGEEEIVNNIAAIQPMLYCDFYTAYCVEPGVFSRERENVYRHNCIYIHVQDENENWYGQPLLLVDKGVFLPMKREQVEESDSLTQYFLDDHGKAQLLKAAFSGGAALEDYLTYTKDCRALEMNRTIYTIKPDVPLNFIHPQILLPCLTDSFTQMAGEHANEMVGELWRVHLARWENIFGKHRATHTIFSKEAMERFARTGRQSDHFFAIRAYTPQERAAILTQIRRQAQENPNFRIYFFKEGVVPPLMEIGLYEGEGTLMSKPYTHYDLAGDHAETIITQKEFCERYKEFYVKDLLERHVITQAEMLAYMDELIRIAQES